ncbi:uncharacterized protein [Littorina saxatilis]|uniref:uncharacterized protein n=1 Tax=Littorina saxatilis TaxID=31220 RepID=UPI0038B4C463
MTWDTAKAGLVGDLGGSTEPLDFFVGLENMHLLSLQADYTVHVSLWGTNHATIFYRHFKLGNESSAYALTYNGTIVNDTPADDGFQATSPLPFSTWDRDTHGCTDTAGSSGWYGPDCTQYSLFATKLIWPVNDKRMTWPAVSLPWARNESALSSEITWKEATQENVLNSCADRPCAETEVCVPATSSKPQHRCLPLATDFGVPAALCDNGGVHNGTQCICPIQHAGDQCERYIRDCTEAFWNGHDNAELSGPYYIQPNTSPAPFLVYCRFEWGGITIPFRRTHPSLTHYNVDWTTVKAGFTTTLTSDLSTADFFVGLENLHHLVSQSFYRLHMSLWRSGEYNAAYTGVFYENFSLGNESTDYTLTYDNYWSRQVDITVHADDGFHASPPVTFHTQDRDTKGCAGMRGAAGWYGADCNGYTLFSDDVLVWPAGGVAQNWTIVDMMLERHGELYEDL